MSDISGAQITKGALGEDIIFRKFSHLIANKGFILHSYEYPMSQDLPGNIKNENGVIEVCPPAEKTEIDILLCTNKFVYPIEVKTYSGSITITSKEIKRSGGAYSVKNPVHQNEMHARHLYEVIYDKLPNGDHKRIRPLVIFTDKCSISDKRQENEINYIPALIINNAVKYIDRAESKGQKEYLDVKQIYSKLMSIGSCKKEMKIL